MKWEMLLASKVIFSWNNLCPPINLSQLFFSSQFFFKESLRETFDFIYYVNVTLPREQYHCLILQQIPTYPSLTEPYCVEWTVRWGKQVRLKSIRPFQTLGCSSSAWNTVKILCLFYVSRQQEKDPVYWLEQNACRA